MSKKNIKLVWTIVIILAILLFFNSKKEISYKKEISGELQIYNPSGSAPIADWVKDDETIAQKIKTYNSFDISDITLDLYRYGMPFSDLTISIRESLQGPNLSVGVLSKSSVYTYLKSYDIQMSSYTLQSNSEYYIVLSASGDDNNRYTIPVSLNGAYTDGQAWSKKDLSNWQQQSTYDLIFKVWGTTIAPTYLQFVNWKEDYINGVLTLNNFILSSNNWVAV